METGKEIELVLGFVELFFVMTITREAHSRAELTWEGARLAHIHEKHACNSRLQLGTSTYKRSFPYFPPSPAEEDSKFAPVQSYISCFPIGMVCVTTSCAQTRPVDTVWPVLQHQ